MNFLLEIIANDPVLNAIYQIVRGIIIFLDFVLLAVMIYALRQLLKYKPKFVYDPRKWERYLKKRKKPQLATPIVASAWTKVESKVKDGSPDSLRLAIIEADGIVGDVLQRMGLSGETFADRLGRLSPERYSTLDKLWDAHRVRNNLVHTPDFHVPTGKAEEAIAAYEAFLKEAKAL